ncbi:MAG: class II fructose-bisphosphate aldolase [Oscillospiraceae bacterium]
MLVSSKELYRAAREKNFAFPAANFVDQLSASAHIAVAEKLGLPLVLAFAQVHQQFLSFDEAIAIGKYYAESAKVPVVLHLDHGTDKDFIFKAIDSGFSSVMIDASAESFEENVRRTKEIVDYAHLRGVVVEAEIGHVGEGSEYSDRNTSNNIYTTVGEAKKFCELTEVNRSPSLSVRRTARKRVRPISTSSVLRSCAPLSRLRWCSTGGSSSGDENLHRCATGGISRINIYTDFVLSAYKKVQERGGNDYYAIRQAMKDGMMECLEHYYDVFDTHKYNA